MRVLVIGGTGFIGRPVVNALQQQGHRVCVLHRGRKGSVPEGVEEIVRDRNEALPALEPDAVIDMICGTERQAQDLVRAFRGRAGRLVAISSGDVYRAHDVLHNHDDRIQPAPIGEDAELRNTPYPYRGIRIEGYDWISEDADKILVERVLAASGDPPATVLRLPMVYGPGDPLHRFRPHIQLMKTGAAEMPIDESLASWRGCWGFVENVAGAIALAATDARARGRTYNVADQNAPEYLGLLQELARLAGWNGRIVPVPKEELPEDQRLPYNYRQSWETDTSRIRRELGYQERFTLAEALSRTLAWERKAAARAV